MHRVKFQPQRNVIICRKVVFLRILVNYGLSWLRRDLQCRGSVCSEVVELIIDLNVVMVSS